MFAIILARPILAVCLTTNKLVVLFKIKLRIYDHSQVFDNQLGLNPCYKVGVAYHCGLLQTWKIKYIIACDIPQEWFQCGTLWDACKDSLFLGSVMTITPDPPYCYIVIDNSSRIAANINHRQGFPNST